LLGWPSPFRSAPVLSSSSSSPSSSCPSTVLGSSPLAAADLGGFVELIAAPADGPTHNVRIQQKAAMSFSLPFGPWSWPFGVLEPMIQSDKQSFAEVEEKTMVEVLCRRQEECRACVLLYWSTSCASERRTPYRVLKWRRHGRHNAGYAGRHWQSALPYWAIFARWLGIGSRYKCTLEEMELCKKDTLNFGIVPCAPITPCIATRKLLSYHVMNAFLSYLIPPVLIPPS
jgi:hypothetical protein